MKQDQSRLSIQSVPCITFITLSTFTNHVPCIMTSHLTNYSYAFRRSFAIFREHSDVSVNESVLSQDGEWPPKRVAVSGDV
jgi:hypothetical protein